MSFDHDACPSDSARTAELALSRQITQLRHALEQAQREAEAQRRQIQSLAERLRQSEFRIQDLLLSSSWRVTRPLRALSRGVARLRGRD